MEYSMLVTYLLALTGISVMAFLMGLKIGKKYRKMKKE